MIKDPNVYYTDIVNITDYHIYMYMEYIARNL